MENRETTAQGHDAGTFGSVQRLPYRSPALVEYGNVSKLTGGKGGTGFDAAGMPMFTRPGCL